VLALGVVGEGVVLLLPISRCLAGVPRPQTTMTALGVDLPCGCEVTAWLSLQNFFSGPFGLGLLFPVKHFRSDSTGTLYKRTNSCAVVMVIAFEPSHGKH